MNIITNKIGGSRDPPLEIRTKDTTETPSNVVYPGQEGGPVPGKGGLTTRDHEKGRLSKTKT